jgi:hypothetical protein
MYTSSLVSVIVIVVVYFFLFGFIPLHQVTSITCVINCQECSTVNILVSSSETSKYQNTWEQNFGFSKMKMDL